MSAVLNPDIVTDGLVLCLDAFLPKSYPGDGNIWYDISGQNNNCQIYNGAYWNNNGIQSSFVFDGVDDNVGRSATTSLQLKNDKTLEFWFNRNSTCGDAEGCLIRAGLGTDAIYYLSSFYTGQLRFQWYNNGFLTGSSTGTHTFDSFSQGCFVMEDLVGTFYINGQSAGTISVSIPSAASASLIGIGATRSGASVGTTAQDFCGQISIVRIYNKALSSSQILNNYNATKTRFKL